MPLSSADNQSEKDLFAAIAARGISVGHQDLIAPAPPELDDRSLPLTPYRGQKTFRPLETMATAEQLAEELERQRRYYAPFMYDLAPALPSGRSSIELKEFDWRVQTEADRQSFRQALSGQGSWEKVRIPHYGGPLGQATTYYRTRFILDEEQLRRGSCFVCFRGVDYKAHVFVNDSFAGSHEGFFAPFEFDVTSYSRVGENTLLVRVDNDYIGLGSETEEHPGIRYTGDKIYAATGPGYDDPQMGWHHCPPGMGIYQRVFVETRSRLHLGDVFVRPHLDEGRAEAWIEVYNCDARPAEVALELSLYGQNFSAVVFEGMRCSPSSYLEVGLGDSLTEANLRKEGKLDRPQPLFAEKGVNRFKFSFSIPDARTWEPSEPWLYQLQAKLATPQDEPLDYAKRQFGMRSFRMETEGERKGKFLLNGKMIRLRGANTMGHEQQCVMNKNWDQLQDDLLLAKIANMNFLRLTQRPVQSEVYELCDRVGLMVQTDLPLFGVLRRNQLCEALRQTEEMERLIRSHPSSILVSYINEPFPNAGNKPHRNLVREELEHFFRMADTVVHLSNPDRVIKQVDGDYDPPSSGLPDNHCYPAWYNGHGLDIGKLHKGHWIPVKPDWYYGCGEFGAEGLDPVGLMQRHYPKEWLPKDAADERNWSPNRIVNAQSGMFHYFFYETPNTLQDWVEASHRHQAWATRTMTEAFRRDDRMNTFAIHLFIDAFPSGWMKTIMDVERNPKPAYFAYRDALTPLMVNLRTDRFKRFSEQETVVEAWVCNDRTEIPEGAVLQYRIEWQGNVISCGEEPARISSCGSRFQGKLRFKAPKTDKRGEAVVRLALLDSDKQVLHNTSLQIEVFPPGESARVNGVCVLGDRGIAARLAAETEGARIALTEAGAGDVILIDDYASFAECEPALTAAVKRGARAILLELPEGEYTIAGDAVSVKSCGMSPLHFAARDPGHPLAQSFRADDFRLWYDPETDYITPFLEATFVADGGIFRSILTSGNTNTNGEWSPALAVAEKAVGEGSIVICQMKLANRLADNPVARQFWVRLLDSKSGETGSGEGEALR